MSDDLAVALALADQADAITLARFGAVDLQVDTKPDLTPVSDADPQWKQACASRWPAHVRTTACSVRSSAGQRLSTGRQWIIDPIDGTKNFVRGVPVWASLIALLTTVYPRSGSSVRRRCIGGGGRPPVRAPSSPSATRRSSAIGFRSGATRFGQPVVLQPVRVGRARPADRFLDLTDEVWRVRAFGDFLSYCFVAEGAVDIAAEPEVSVWDLAPLDILVREAGGTFTAWTAQPARTAATRWPPTGSCTTRSRQAVR